MVMNTETGYNPLTLPSQIRENPLSNPWGFSLKGIRPEGTCPVCDKTFKWDGQKGYICPVHLTSPQRYTVDFFYKGERIRRGTTLDGKTLRSFADAHSLLRQAENEKASHKLDPTKWKSKDRLEFRFSYLIDNWYKEKEKMMQQGKLAPSYVTKLFSYMQHYYLPYFNDQDVREIFSCKDFTNQLPERLSLKYQKNILDALRHFFRWLKEDRLINEVPVFPSIEVPEHEPKTISKDIQIKILGFIPAEHKPIFTFLFYQGCRPGEVRALKWDCIEKDIVTYKRTWSAHKLREVTKTKRIRHNLIFHEAMAVLPKRHFPNDFVFIHGKQLKRPYSQTYLQEIFSHALIRFNAKYGTALKIGLYEATKHSFGTQLVNDGVSLELLKGWFGHTSTKMTEKYAKLKVVEAFRDLQKVRGLKKGDRQ